MKSSVSILASAVLAFSGTVGVLLHTNIETTEAIPATSLAATTRAYAKIIEQVNNMSLSELTQ